MPENFIRHYYDIYQLLDYIAVKEFIGSPEYKRYKIERFGTKDDKNISNNQAFKLENKEEFNIFEREYQRTSALYFKEQPNLNELIKRIQNFSGSL